jgi:hypothetical protein
VESHDAGDILAEIVASFAAGGATAACHGPVHHHLVADLEIGAAYANGCNFTGGFGPDDQGKLPLGERHSPKAP